jgi:DNA-binding NarL/FixJ family response regulator
MNTVIRVLIVDRILLMCNMLITVLEDEPDLEVVASTTSVNEALELAKNADIALIDIQLPDDGAYRLTRAIARAGLSVKVLILGMTEARQQVIQYIQVGAAGYVLADDTVADLLGRIRDAYSGQARISPRIASAMVTRINEYQQLLQRVRTSAFEMANLTVREREILDLICKGYTNQEIASQLFIGLGTTKNHVHNILQKMDVSSRQEAAVNWSLVREDVQAFPGA